MLIVLQTFHFIAEFATPLMSLYEMELGSIAGLSSQQKQHQRKLFHDKLQEILIHPSNSQCHNCAIVVPYRGKVLLRAVRLLCSHLQHRSTILMVIMSVHNYPYVSIDHLIIRIFCATLILILL